MDKGAQAKIIRFRKQIEKVYAEAYCPYGSFGEILCYELHSQPVNPRLPCEKGLTFKEIAQKWGITLSFLGDLIADHCRKL